MKRNDFLKENNVHKVIMNDKQIEFLIKCIDISQSLESITPDKSEIELIRNLTNIHEDIQELKLGSDVYYDLN